MTIDTPKLSAEGYRVQRVEASEHLNMPGEVQVYLRAGCSGLTYTVSTSDARKIVNALMFETDHPATKWTAEEILAREA